MEREREIEPTSNGVRDTLRRRMRLPLTPPEGNIVFILSERFPVTGGKHPLDVRFLIKNLATQLVVGNHSVVAVVLQGAAAHFQPCRHLSVREEASPPKVGRLFATKFSIPSSRRSSASPNWATSAWFLVIISLIATLDLVVHTK